jgi:hypothetical protein
MNGRACPAVFASGIPWQAGDFSCALSPRSDRISCYRMACPVLPKPGAAPSFRAFAALVARRRMQL